MVVRSRFSAQTPSLAIREQRVFISSELRASPAGAEGLRNLTGYAAVFNQPSEVLSDWWAGRFIEFIAEGAFKNTLQSGADVRALLNHDPNWVLGRTKANTLRLWEDSKGLGFEVTPPNTQWARDLVDQVARGDITQASFGFQTVRDRWALGQLDDGSEIDERWVLEVKLFDISPATFPAYPQTRVEVVGAGGERSIDREVEERIYQRLLAALEARSSSPPPPVIEPVSPPLLPPVAPDHGTYRAWQRLAEARAKSVTAV